MTVKDVIILSTVFNFKVSQIEPFLDGSDYRSALNNIYGYTTEDFGEDAVQTCIHQVEEALRDGQTIVITYWDELYPKPLREIDDPPAVLFARGKKFEVLKKEPKIAIVGSRKSTAYGKKVARRLSMELAKVGFVVVSGLAAGIDSEAHHGACSAGETIGVLGNGVDVVYPPFNSHTYASVKENGCLLSEYLPRTPPHRWHFPKRNRIIAGMCVGVVVVEAGKKSGSLITARLAADYGRDVFAVPGPITSETSRGTNLLIGLGAKPIQGVEDILEEYPHFAKTPSSDRDVHMDLSEEERELFQLILEGNDTLEKLSTLTGWDIGKLVTTLSRLEVIEKIAQIGGRYTPV